MESFGFAMGPFAVADLVGIWTLRGAYGERRPPPAIQMLATFTSPTDCARRDASGARPARATTATKPEARDASPIPSCDALIGQASKAKGIVRRPLASEEIRRRAMLAMVNEAALLIGEGVAERATDVDVVLVAGYGFPALGRRTRVLGA